MRARYFIFSTLLMLSERWTIKTDFFSSPETVACALDHSECRFYQQCVCVCVCVHATHGRSVGAHTRSGVYHRRIGIYKRTLGRKLHQVRCVCLWFTKYVNKRCDV